jgi:hypothetical protein
MAVIGREIDLSARFIRLGVILGSMLIGAALWAYMRPPSITTVPSAPEATIALAAPVVPARSDAESSNPPGVNSDRAAAAKMMIPAPPGTELTLQNVDPSRLRASFRRGTAVIALENNFDDETTRRGARLLRIAAILGYAPARTVIVQEYPRSPIIRSTVPSSEAVRYALDPLLVGGSQGESSQVRLAFLASYFSGRHQLEAYGGDLLAALRDDQRLQTDDNLQALLNQLSRVRGACVALGRAMVKARVVTSPECSSRLQLQIQNFIRMAGPLQRESDSRRQALRLLESPNAVEVSAR